MQTVDSGPTDAALLLAYRRGEREAFTTLYDRYGDRLFFYARSLPENAHSGIPRSRVHS